MKAKNVLRDEHGPGHVTPAGRSVFYDLFPRDKADELVMRATLLSGLALVEEEQAHAGSSCQGVAHHAGSGIGHQARQDRAIQPGYAGSPRIAGGTQAQTKTSKVRSGEVNNDREEINGCAETATPDRTQSHSRIRKMAEGKSGKPGRAEVTRRTCDGVR